MVIILRLVVKDLVYVTPRLVPDLKHNVEKYFLKEHSDFDFWLTKILKGGPLDKMLMYNSQHKAKFKFSRFSILSFGFGFSKEDKWVPHWKTLAQLTSIFLKTEIDSS